MISKGNTHQNGAKLAHYMMTGKDGERAECFELRGFASDDLKEAFRSVHVMAEATRCEQPFFHCQIRNPDGEQLTREQWLRVADRIETKLGLTDQPRAIYFHTNDATGHEHMHVAWSRIDAETMRAVPLPFFKYRLKAISRELEIELDLTRVKNERDGPVMAPNRNEFEEARRLGVDIKEVRQTIRDCFERSDCGRSFEGALAEHGFVLAQGARRAFIVIDHEGGLHALSKRILGITAGQTSDRLADLERDELPTVEQARSFVREQQAAREKAEQAAMPNPDREHMAWEDALANAAIDKEKVERRFVEPNRARETQGDSTREKDQQSRPQPAAPELGRTGGEIRLAYSLTKSGQAFADALEDRGLFLASVSINDLEKLKGLEQRRAVEERAAYLAKLKYLDQRTAEAEKAGDLERVAVLQLRRADLAQKADAALPWMAQEGGVEKLSPEHLNGARVSYDAWQHRSRYSFEDYVSYVQEQWQNNPGQRHSKSRFRAGDLVVVNQFGEVHGLTLRNTGDDRKTRQEYLKNVDRAPLPSVTEAWAVLKDLDQHRRDEALWPAREKHWPLNPPEPRPIKTSPVYGFEFAGWATCDERRPLNAPKELQGKFSATFKDLPEAGHIWEAYNRNRHNPNAFASALEKEGILLAGVTKEEADRSHRQGAFSKEIGRFSPIYREGEIVGVGPSARVYKLNDRTTGQDRAEVERFLKKLDRTQLQGIEETKQIMHERAEAREAYAYLQGVVNPVKPRRETLLPDNLPKAALSAAARTIDRTLNFGDTVIKSPLAPEITAPLKKAGRAASKALDAIGNTLEAVLAPVLTPEQKRAGARKQAERFADAADKIDLSQYLADRELARQHQEREQEATRQRHRETERER